MRTGWGLTGLATVAFLVSQAHLAWMLAPLKPNILVLQLAFTPERFQAVLDTWGPQGLALFREHFRFDNWHALLYGAFGWLLAGQHGIAPEGWRASAALRWGLPLAGLADLAENALHLHLVDHPQASSGTLVGLASTAATVKWALVATFAAVVAARLALLAGSRR